MEEKDLLLQMISRSDTLYIKDGYSVCDKALLEAVRSKQQETDFLSLYRIDEVTFEDKAPRKEALENVISSMNLAGVHFVYLIIGDGQGVSFYYGVAKDFYSESNAIEIGDIGDMILKPSLQGNFRGSVITEIDAQQKKELLEQLDSMHRARIVEGVAGINKDDEKFQSVDRLTDVMLGDIFALLLIAKPMPLQEITKLREQTYRLYDTLAPLAKQSMQESSGESQSSTQSTTSTTSTTKGSSTSYTKQHSTGSSKSHTTGESTGKNAGTSRSTAREKGESKKTTETISGSEGSQSGKSTSDTNGESINKSESDTTGRSESSSESESSGTSEQSTSNTGLASTKELVNKKVQEWLKYIDDVVFPKLDYGAGKGLFTASVALFGKELASLVKLENTIRSLYGGESGNRMPLKAFDLQPQEAGCLKRMQIPYLEYDKGLQEDENGVRIACSQYFADKQILDRMGIALGYWMSSRELSLMAGLPQKEVIGLALREEVEFGLNQGGKQEQSFLLGHLVQSGVVMDGTQGAAKMEVYFDKSYFSKHIFVTGVTGSGKTTTCQKLLLESKENFLVIEPAKTEYRILATTAFNDLLVFTLGNETGAPFRLNPFEFLEGESITSRVDMIKASMEAAFDMEAAIPQILETAIYECYEEKGWDISTNKNQIYEHPYADGVNSFPTLSQLYKKISMVVEEQGFDARLKDEYIGSIHARLNGLLVGAKGMMLDTPRSVDFVELLDKRVVLELENIKSVSEKSLLMGFILTNLSEAVKVKYAKVHKPIAHLTLIEEAHRLLSRFQPGDSLNKKQGVELFTDLLAEVRKYGESFIIAEQIPNKLTPEVLKNTNTKIVHKIFAQDDKEAIGNTMALKEEQKEHLSYLADGRAILMHPGLKKAVQVQILQTEENDTSRVPPQDADLRGRIADYYAKVYRKGILPGLEKLQAAPSREQVEIYLEYFQPNHSFIKGYQSCIHFRKVVPSFLKYIEEICEKLDCLQIAEYLSCICHDQKRMKKYPEILEYIAELLEGFKVQGAGFQVGDYEHYDKLDDSLLSKNK